MASPPSRPVSLVPFTPERDFASVLPMSDTGRTVPHKTSGLALRALSVEVVAGPDVGKRIVAKRDSLTIGTAKGNDLELSDDTVSRFHLELERVSDRIFLRDNGSTNGVEAGGVLIHAGVVRSGAILRCGKTKLKVDDADPITLEVLEGDELGGLRGRAPIMRRLLADVDRAAQSDAPVLILGETGSGKEVIARALHDASARAGQPFEIVDCGTLMPNLIASELFGHEKGSFTGAVGSHAGAFQRAQGGTLFLDEVGELPEALQPVLLGVLERKMLRTLGGTQMIPVDVRIIAATHRDLRAAVNAGRFRQDLYYRLAVIVCKVPPLRDRLEDLVPLIEQFLAEAGHEGPLEELFPDEVFEMLRAHPWPGNVRELRNFVEVTLALGRAPSLEGDGAPAIKRREGGLDLSELIDLPYSVARGRLLEEFESSYLAHLIERAGGNVSKAARIANMNRSYLRQLMARYNPKRRD
jgi:DNA-binding NtrC family response regulator